MSAYVSIRQHTSAYVTDVSRRMLTAGTCIFSSVVGIREHT
jgi:hypothetical protein